MNVLRKADELIHGDRNEAYGDATEQFTRVANIWSALLGFDVAPEKVPLCMTALKLVRATSREDPDDFIDAAGYIGLAAQVRGYEESAPCKHRPGVPIAFQASGVYRYCLTHGRYEKIDGTPAPAGALACGDLQAPVTGDCGWRSTAPDPWSHDIRREPQENRVPEAGIENGAPVASGPGEVLGSEPVGGEAEPCLHCGRTGGPHKCAAYSDLR